jgi:hypothetical protein
MRTNRTPPSRLPRLPWPLPALLAWGAAWAVFLGLGALHWPLGLNLTLAALFGLALGRAEASPWRSLIIAAGFPLSLAISSLLSGTAGWLWLIPLALLALLYPLRTWRDAPLFPTPAGILQGLDKIAPLSAGARILDAGCGLGSGLKELRRVYPRAQLHGLEWSWPLRFLCGLTCPFARVRRGDIWETNWSAYHMVYMFQRPESMGPAADKARRELPPGAWLVSLEFEAPALRPVAVLRNRGDKPVFVYRMK